MFTNTSPLTIGTSLRKIAGAALFTAAIALGGAAVIGYPAIAAAEPGVGGGECPSVPSGPGVVVDTNDPMPPENLPSIELPPPPPGPCSPPGKPAQGPMQPQGPIRPTPLPAGPAQHPQPMG
jgi:hypothetical protein